MSWLKGSYKPIRPWFNKDIKLTNYYVTFMRANTLHADYNIVVWSISTVPLEPFLYF